MMAQQGSQIIRTEIEEVMVPLRVEYSYTPKSETGDPAEVDIRAITHISGPVLGWVFESLCKSETFLGKIIKAHETPGQRIVTVTK